MAWGASSAASNTAANSAPEALRHWQALRHTGDIQYAPLPPYTPPPPSLPDWLIWLGRLLKRLTQWADPLGKMIGPAWPWIEWAVLGLGALLVLALLWRIIRPLVAKWQGRPARMAEEDWAPPAAEALALLADADRLAEQGRYDEAAHLLLHRSIHHIASARPDMLHPASTAREIATLPALSAAARGTFGTIAALVERSRYALHPLALPDWQQARDAYASFAATRIASA